MGKTSASKQRSLILPDDFETPWNAPATGTQKQNTDIVRQLAELSHIAIFIAKRGTNPPCDNAIEWESTNIERQEKKPTFVSVMTTTLVRRTLMSAVY
jgi:hypothetical protein